MKFRRKESSRSTPTTHFYQVGALLAAATIVSAIGCSRSAINPYEPDTADAFDTGSDSRVDADFDTEFDTNFDVDFDVPPDSDFDTDFDVPPDNVCGDGIVRGNEECDDGNRRNNDGCDRQCRFEEMAGMCLGEPDREIVESGFAFDIANECFEQCFFGDGIDVECTADCMSGNTGMSFTCGECFGLIADCIVVECLDVCQVDEQACEACQQEQCVPGFEECSGIPFIVPDENVCGDGIVRDGEECDDGNRRNGDGCDRRCRREDDPDGMCTSNEDREIVESGFAGDALQECFDICYDGGNDIDDACIASCENDITGMSFGCGECYGGFVGCIVRECLEVCQFDDRECEECQQGICLPRFQDCSGLGFP